MNITANTVASKLFVAFVAAAMLVTLATPAKAATATELQAQIDALMAQISALQGSTGGTTSTSAACTFTRALTVGSEGADVKCLQDYLTPKYFTNAGGSTGYFGAVTASAVAAWQTANGITPAVGYFGPVSQAKYNAMAAVDTSDDSSDEDSSSDDSDDTASGDLSGEASLNQFDIEDGDDTELEEGQSADSVQEFQVEFQDGDAMITRLDVELDTDATDDIWDVLGDVTLYADGEEVATIDGSDEDNYQDDEMTLRFSGLDIVAMEDDETTITLGVEVQNNLDDTDQTVTVDVISMRFVDGDDVTSTETEGTLDTAGASAGSFDIAVAGNEDELVVGESDADPTATTFALENDAKSDWETAFVWSLDTDDSTNDITVNNITATVTVSSSTYNARIDDVKLVIDGVTYDDVTVSGGTTVNGVLDFDLDGDLVIDAGEEVDVALMLKFKALTPSGEEGTTVSVSTDSDTYDAEGADNLTTTQLQGSATGETHSLRTEGAELELTDDSTSLKGNTDSTTADDEGVYTLEFDVTAFNGDLYIDDSAASGTTMGTEGANFIVTQNGSTVTTGVRVATLDSDATLTGGRFKVAEGSTKSFTLTVEYDPESTGSYKVQLYSVNFSVDANGNPTTAQRALPAEDFDTASLTI